MIELEVTQSGGLSGRYEYVRWEPGDNEVVLDGQFDLDSLKAIVAHIENQSKG